MKLITLVILVALLSSSGKAQTSGYAVGVEYGAHIINSPGNTRGLGLFGATKGVIVNNFINDRLTLYSGLYLSDQFSEATFYKVPFRAAYSLGRRNQSCFDKRNRVGYGTASPPRRGASTDILDLLLFRFIPQTIEIEGGLSMGVYSKKTSELTKELNYTVYYNNQLVYAQNGNREVLNTNRRIVPTFDLGVRWWFKVWNFRLYVHPAYSIMPFGDNKTTRTDLITKKVETMTSYSSFSMTGGLMYVWDYE